jgi:hypothetical protein
VLRMVPFCLHAVANTPAGLMELVRSYRSTNFGLPRNWGGSAPALVFSGPAQRSLTLRPARSPSRLATLCTRGFSSFVASTAALIATGWSEPVPGRVYPAVDQHLFAAHPVIRLARRLCSVSSLRQSGLTLLGFCYSSQTLPAGPAVSGLFKRGLGLGAKRAVLMARGPT